MNRLKIARFFPAILILVVAITGIVAILAEREQTPVELLLSTPVGTADTVQYYGRVAVVEAQKIAISRQDFLMAFLAPVSENYFFDGLHLLMVIIICSIGIITFWNFSYYRPFTRQTTLGVRLIANTLLAFCYLFMLRNIWMKDQLQDMTGQKFHLYNYNMIPWWGILLYLLLLRIVKVFKKGHSLQQEQDFTV